MGLDFSYLLYFKREHLWEALQGVAAIAEPHHPPTMIHFPDHTMAVPLESWLLEDRTVQHDDPEFSFSIVLNFEEDEAIEDYVYARDRGDADTERSPPDTEETNQVSIGYIYLTVYNDLSRRITLIEPTDLVLFDFGTTGTRMSLLFDYSTSIRKTFIDLLERCHGLCGVFNREYGGGELFWLKGQSLSEYFEDAYLMPQEIEGLLRKGRLGDRNDGS